jgi:hypothetical protein
MNALVLILKHSAKFAMIGGLGGIFMFLGKMAICSLTTFGGFLMIEDWPSIHDSIDSPTIPCIIIFMSSYVVSSIFVSVYSISSNTILQCFLVDTDIAE